MATDRELTAWVLACVAGVGATVLAARWGWGWRLWVTLPLTVGVVVVGVVVLVLPALGVKA